MNRTLLPCALQTLRIAFIGMISVQESLEGRYIFFMCYIEVRSLKMYVVAFCSKTHKKSRQKNFTAVIMWHLYLVFLYTNVTEKAYVRRLWIYPASLTTLGTVPRSGPEVHSGQAEGSATIPSGGFNNTFN